MLNKYKYLNIVFYLIALFLLFKFSYSTPVVISDVEDFYDPLPYNDGNITITAVINRIDAGEKEVWVSILSPVEENLSWIKKEFIDSQTNKYYFTYNPSQIGTYLYKVYAINTNNETSESQTHTFESAKFPYFESIAYNSSVKWDNGSVEFYITMRRWVDYRNNSMIEYNVSSVIVMIKEPEIANVSLTKISEEGNLSLWYGSFDPSIISLYKYGVFDPIYKFQVFSNDTYGNVSVSEEMSFVSEGYYPKILGSYISHKGILSVGENITIYAIINDTTNATNYSPNINSTKIYLLKPDLSLMIYNMTKINDSYYYLNFTIDIEGDYFYKIFVSDEEGNEVESGYFGFSSSPHIYDIVNISVKVAPSCQASIFLLPDEDKLLVNTTVIWLSIFENLGNVPLNETTNISVEKDVIYPGEEKFVILPPNIVAYARDKEEEVDPLDDTFFFLIWYTYGLPLGNYTARTYSTYYANVSYEGGYFTCNGTVNDTVHFELVEAIGETTPSPILVIREMPEQIYQDPDCINDSQSCITTKVRLVLFNRGDKVAENITLKERIYLYDCAYSNSSLCEKISLKCVNSSQYSCAVTTNKSTGEIGSLQFNMSESLSPRDYVILEYELTPPPYLVVYNDSVYKFEAKGSHKCEGDKKKYEISENDLHYNKEEYKLMHLSPLPSFMFDLTVLSSNTTEKRRTFSAEKDEEFLISADYISSISTSNWTINISFPEVFIIKSCSFVDGVQCECRVDNASNIVYCDGSSLISENDKVEFKVTARTNIYSEYILPAYFNDSIYMADEDFLPGLFMISIPKTEVEVPTPQPVPQPTPQPQPEPQPETGPEISEYHLPKVEIVLRPLNDTYVVYQGDTFPTYFEVENIGNSTANNITIEAILPSALWNQSKAYIDVLNPGEKVNRTLMFSVDENVAPGIYVIPVKAMIGDSIGDIAYITIKVLFAKKLAKMKIIEMAQEIEIREDSNLTVPILIKNIGRKVLHNVSVRIENVEECIEKYSSSRETLNLNESKTIFLYLKSKPVKSKECKAIVIAYSDEGAYDFMPVIIKVYPKPPLLALRRNLTPIISLLWTLIFILYAVIRKRKAMRGERPKSKVPRLILYLLMLGELLIIIYVILWLIGLVSLL